MKAEVVITSSALIIVIAALRLIFRKKVAPGFIYALWLAAALRLLLPFSLLGSDISVMNALPSETKAVSAQAAPMVSPPAGANAPAVKPAVIPTADGDAKLPATVKAVGHISATKWLEYAYFGGAALTAAALIAGNVRFYTRLRRSRRLCETNAPLRVYVSPAIPGPCLFGLFRPAVYLTPETAADETKRLHIIAHELTHYRHLDHVWGYVRLLCLAVHWYNPLVWLAAALSKRDGELACDADAIKRLGEENRVAYARTLIETAAGGRRALFCTASTLSAGKSGMKDRIAMIVKKPKTAAALLCALLLIAAATVGCTFTGAKKADAKPETETIEPESKPETAAPTRDEAKAEEPALTGAEQNAKPFKPAEAHDFVSAKLVMSFGSYVTEDEGSLRALEEMFGSAEEVFATACPFSSEIYLTRADGEVFTAHPAEDSCAVLEADGAYYDYGDDNSALWELFGVKQSHTEYEYDAEGRATKATEFWWTVPGAVTEYEYDAAGYVVKETYTSGDKSATRVTEYTRDAAGRETERAVKDISGLTYSLLSEYDAAGNLVKTERIGMGGKERSVSLYAYDAANRLVSAEYYNNGTTLGYSEKYSYDGANAYSKSTYTAGGELSQKNDYLLDNAGNVLKNTRYMADGTVEAVWEYDFGEKDGCIAVKQYDGGGKLIDTWTEGYAAEEISALSAEPKDYGITDDELSAKMLPDFSSFSLAKLGAYYLNTDAAGAEGSSDELYRRFVSRPEAVLEYLSLIGGAAGRSGEPALTELCRAIASADVFWHDSSPAFAETVASCKAAYPGGVYADIIRSLEAEHDAAKSR